MSRIAPLILTQMGVWMLAISGFPLSIENGWYVNDGRVIWGYAQQNEIWRMCIGITRRHPDKVGPCLTEDLNQLTDAMLTFGYPGFDYCPGLWYDRRRDAHDIEKRTDSNAVPPFFEQPWLRSGPGRAWDGLFKYDLTRFNDWYYSRLREFAGFCDAKGTILFHNYYMQHALLEKETHYVDFPWRPVNCLQATGMPETIPAANAFYDLSNEVRRDLHRAYIRKCLDELGAFQNVIHLLSQEYTGPLPFMEFWIDEIMAWERENGVQIKVGLAGTKDVLDAVLRDPVREPEISTISLSYWWYKADGELVAPPGGQEIRGRLFVGETIAEETSPRSLYRQIKEYRRLYPDKAIIQHHRADRQKQWAFLMGGGSMISAYLFYPDGSPPTTYIAPNDVPLILPAYQFVNEHLSTALPQMKPADLILDNTDRNWCLADGGNNYLIYASEGGNIRVDLSSAVGADFIAQWLQPTTGVLSPASLGVVQGGRPVAFKAPDNRDWVLWLRRRSPDG